MEQRRYLEIAGENGTVTRAAYFDSGGSGRTVLFLHGFAESSATWEMMLQFMPTEYRYIRLDLKGFGYTSKNDSEHLSIGGQVRFAADFIRKLDLAEFALAGHSMGGAIAVLTAAEPDIAPRISKLILLGSTGVSSRMPGFISKLAARSAANPLLRFSGEELMAYLVMRGAYFREEAIDPELVRKNAAVLQLPGARDCMIAAAEQCRFFDSSTFRQQLGKLHLPVLLLWGAEDKITELEEGEAFREMIPGSQFYVLPECGHSPQEELPEETAQKITGFLKHGKLSSAPGIAEPETAEQSLRRRSLEQLRQLSSSYKLKMTRLVDRWSFGTLFLLGFIKILQLLKKFGMRAEENGWRKATGIFLRSEYSKFVLSCFRLTYYKRGEIPADFAGARRCLIENLAEYIRAHSQLHWSASHGVFQLGRRKVSFTDIAEAFYDESGELVSIEPHFDSARENFRLLGEEEKRAALQETVAAVNRIRRRSNVREHSHLLARRMRRYVRRAPGFRYAARQELRNFVERLLTATYLHCELLPQESGSAARRLATPNLRKYRNPGWGLLNVIVRFTADFSEADLWLQYHHVPVDGMPMQELLADLKASWGCRGVLPYPEPGSDAALPEVTYVGNRLFRTRFFADFSSLLALRKELNAKYESLMEGPVTVAGMILWGLAQHSFFRNSKMLFPVDTEVAGSGNLQEREVSLVFIRAGRYRDRSNPLSGFLNFQKEFNRRLWRTRAGKSESYELLELYSMLHPLFYQIGHRLMSEAMGEFVGSMGISVLRNAEIFIAPVSDLQINGFMTLGELDHPTGNGGKAGAVSACGTRDQIRFYHDAVLAMTADYRRFLTPEGC